MSADEIGNPDVGKPAKVGQPEAPPQSGKVRRAGKRSQGGKGTRFEGSELTTNIDSYGKGTARSYWYWVGVYPSCPVEHITLGGICFPKINAKQVPHPSGVGKTLSTPFVGAIVKIDEVRLLRIRDRLPRTVIRFLSATPGEAAQLLDDPAGYGQGSEAAGTATTRPRQGHVITIRTDEEIKAAQKAGKPARAYEPNRQTDAPAARFMFAQLCEDQDNPQPGPTYPETLEDTGLEWPDELTLDVA